MTYKITNPHSAAFTFDDFKISPGTNEFRGKMPAAVLQGMRDAGMTIEVVGAPASAAAAPSEPATGDDDAEEVGEEAGDDEDDTKPEG